MSEGGLALESRECPGAEQSVPARARALAAR
jgi:hypothetical protein